MTKKIEYSKIIGILKTLKNEAIILTPFVLGITGALKLNLDESVAGLIGFLLAGTVYYIKNYIQNK